MWKESKVPTPLYGSYDGRAVRWLGYEAWLLGRDGVWRETDAADVATGAAVLSREQFHTRFGTVPLMPKAAFQSSE